MTPNLPSHGPRVAESPLEVIPEGDGVPTTHTPLSAAPDRKVTSALPDNVPHPFAAKPPRSNSLLALAITVVTCVLGAVPTWLITDDLTMVAVVVAALVMWCSVLAAPALAGWANPAENQLRRQSIGEEMNQ